MSYAIRYDVPGTPEIYARVSEQIGSDQPDGLILRFVIQAPGGLTHYSVWDSKEQWERFRDERARPAVNKVLADMGMTQPPPPPVEEEIDVVDVFAPATATAGA